MKRKMILPVSDPEITVYPIFADPLSVLKLHESAEGWLMNSFLQICTNHEALNFYDFNYRLCPFLKIQRISVSFIKDMGMTLHEFLMDSIDRGFYPYMLVGMRQIELYGYKGQFTHDLLINGYDEEAEIYHISDNFKGGKYSRKTCSFSELEAAAGDLSEKYRRRLGFRGAIELLEFDGEETTEFSLERVKDSLSDYILGKPTTEWNVIEYRNRYGGEHWLYGIDCYEYLKDGLSKINECSELQDYQLFWEHKKHILKLIGYLQNKEFLSAERGKDFSLSLEEIVHSTMVVRNLLIKYKITKNTGILGKVSNSLDSIKEKEISIIKELLPLL